MKEMLKRFVHEEAGQDLIEYALLAGLIALATITAVTSVANALSGKFNAAGTAVTNAGS